MRRTPLVWKNLIHDPMRLLLAMAGVGFAVLLMFLQTGFQNALFDSTVAILRQLNADLVIVSKAKYSLVTMSRFPRSRLQQAASLEGVAAATPLYTESFGRLRMPGQRSRPIRVIAYPMAAPALTLPGVAEQQSELAAPRALLIDWRTSGYKYDRKRWRWGIPRDREKLAAIEGAELAGRRVSLVGGFSLGTDFANEGNLIASDTTFAQLFPQRNPGNDPLSVVDLGLVRVEPGYQVEAIRRELAALLPDDEVEVVTRQELIQNEIGFWQRSTPIGIIFTAGTLVGVLVGMIFCYQIIQTDVSEKMAEFATLKAIGYPRGYFVSVVMRQAVYLAAAGFLPGWLLSALCYEVISRMTGLVMQFSAGQFAFVLAVTVAMCCVSGAFVVRKLAGSDAADLF